MKLNETLMEQIRGIRLSNVASEVEIVRKAIAATGIADSELAYVISDDDFMLGVCTLALTYMNSVAAMEVDRGEWMGLVVGDSIARGELRLQGEPLLPFFTYAVMLVAGALLASEPQGR